MPPERYHRYGSRIALMHATERFPPKPYGEWDSERTCVRCRPGSNYVSDCGVGRFYEYCLKGGDLTGRQIKANGRDLYETPPHWNV